ncbi:MAG: hypothetical protein QOE70_2597 [Chthoniobacter sp.]|jgi:hypothetical protein|nr:hypothetical protein [Chthoniobacter sp.]
MKRIEALSIAGVLCAGSVVGFVGARWGGASEPRNQNGPAGESAVSVAARATQPVGAEVASARSEGDMLENLLQDKLRSRRLVALDQFLRRVGCGGRAARGASASAG